MKSKKYIGIIIVGILSILGYNTYNSLSTVSYITNNKHKNSKVIATVDSRTITNKDVKDYILLVNESFFFETDTLSLKPLDMLIDQQLLLSYARDNNIVVSKHDLSNEISEYKLNFNKREKNNKLDLYKMIQKSRYSKQDYWNSLIPANCAKAVAIRRSIVKLETSIAQNEDKKASIKIIRKAFLQKLSELKKRYKVKIF
jgi:hypothetical protein